MLPRAAPFAATVPVLFLATIGVLLMPLGWRGIGLLIPADQRERVEALQHLPAGPPWHPVARPVPTATDIRSVAAFQKADLYAPMLSAAHTLVNPLVQMLRPGASWPQLAYWLLGSIWNLLVWGLFGGVITRMAVMRYGRNQREGLGAAYRFVSSRLSVFVQTPLFVLSAVVLVLVLFSGVGWISEGNVGRLLASLVWFLVLIGGLIVAILVVGIALGWPLIWGALSTEEMGDVFEGAQRTFAYFYGRPLHYAFYALVTIVVGSVCSWVINLLVRLVIYFSSWGLWEAAADSPMAGGSAAAVGEAIIGRLNQLVLTVGAAFPYGFLFAAAGIVYLLVRRDTDQIEFDNVHVPGRQVRPGLPPLTTDEAGVPDTDAAD